MDDSLVEGPCPKLENRLLSGYKSLENSPQLDRESLLRYSEDSKDEFWDALSSNYDYLMDDGLIATCREANSDLSLDDENDTSESGGWTMSRFIEQFRWLHDILHTLQVSKDDPSTKMQEVYYHCTNFNEQAQSLCKKYPDVKEEVQRHLNILNNKWKAVEQSINPNIVKSPSKDSMLTEITSRMGSLRKWLRGIEDRHSPISLNSSWTYEELEQRYQQQTVLETEIAAKGKFISALLQLCDHLKGNVRFGQNSVAHWDAEKVKKVAENLQNKWHSIYLQSMEQNVVLENLLQNSKAGNDKFEKSFSEEPLKKYPRLSDQFELFSPQKPPECDKVISGSDSVFSEGTSCQSSQSQQTSSSNQKVSCLVTNDKAVMVGSTGIAELKAANGTGKFEIIQDVGYSSETSTHLSMDEKTEHFNGTPPTENFSPPLKKTIVTDNASSPQLHLPPDKYQSAVLKTLNILSEESPYRTPKRSLEKNSSSTFYKVACIDDDALIETTPTNLSYNSKIKTSTPAQLTLPSTPQNQTDKSIVEKLLQNIEREVALNPSCCSPTLESLTRKNPRVSKRTTARSLNDNSVFRNGSPISRHTSARVSEWLRKCHGVNSSNDASGECTTESDSDKSNASDVNNSVTMSQSFTGSIETVIPAITEDNNPSQEPFSSVKLRKKKGTTTRDRPWSVIEANQVAAAASMPCSSFSESALDSLQDCNKSSSKDSSQRNKRKSLTDINDDDLAKSQSLDSKDTEDQQSHLEKFNSWKKEAIIETFKLSRKIKSTNLLKPDEKLSDIPIVFSETSSVQETASGCGGSIEDGSISWDEYRDPPYLSEPYSEQTVDEDEVRKLLSFGDDYRAILGSYSDVSSGSVKIPTRHRSRTKSSLAKSLGEETCCFDSDSDTEDFNHILLTSTHAFQFVSNAFKELKLQAEPQSSKLAELIATCQTNLCHLNEIASAGSELDSVSKEDIIKLEDLIRQWDELNSTISTFARHEEDKNPKSNPTNLEAATIDVHSSLALLKEKLGSLADHAMAAVDTAISIEQVEANIKALQSGLSQLQEMKDAVLSVSARILRLIADGGGASLAPLKENATKLYQQWEDVYELNSSQLTKLQTLQSKWSASTVEELQAVSETTVQWKPVQVGCNLPKAEMVREAIHPKTAAEVQNAVHVEVLPSFERDNAKVINGCNVVEEIEEELHQSILKSNTPVVKTRLAPSEKPEPTPHSPLRQPSSLWRLIRAALPIQATMVAVYCLSWLLNEPQCCEHLNNYEFCMLPHLRYLNGPPPN